MPDRPAETPLDILFEDNHLLIVNKPALMATMGTKDDVTSVLNLAKTWVRTKYQKPGNVYLGVVSRLDSVVTGALVFARTSKAAARLSEQFRNKTVRKIYRALVAGKPSSDSGLAENWLWRDELKCRTMVVASERPGAQRAILKWKLVAGSSGTSLLEIDLETGRKHQIRAQLSHLGLPILGDSRYGSVRSFPAGIALHAAELTLSHPIGGRTLTVTAPVPASWNAWRQLHEKT